MTAVVTKLAAKPIGRPRAEIDLERLRELAGLGLPLQAIANRLGVGKATLIDRMASDAETRNAYESGVAEAIEFAAASLRKLSAEGNLGALIFFLKTKGGFNVPRETSAPAVVVNVGQQLAPITADHAYELAENQRRMLAEDWQEEQARQR